MTNTKRMQDKIQSKYKLGEAFSVNTDNTETQPPVQPALKQNSNTDNNITPYDHGKQTTPPQTSKPSYARKMTLYVTEELHKAFSDIYATRLLQGRATEKSTLICEAISLLYEKEKNEGKI